MFILANLIEGVTVILRYLVRIMIALILIKILMSFFDPGPLEVGHAYTIVTGILEKLTEPLLGPLRILITVSYKIGMDLSPAFAIILLWLVDMFVLGTLLQFANRLKAK